MMKAVRIHTYGGSEVLVYEDAPRPEIAGDQVLVEVYAASANPVDRFTRAGYLQGMVDFALPVTLGLDLSGVVEAVGKDVTTVLIHGAGGGVGAFAVQFALAKGARVLGMASANHATFLHELGVAEVIDYTTSRFEDVARDVDVVLDTIGGEVAERSWDVLRPGGALVTLAGQPDQEVAAARGVHGLGVVTQAKVADLIEIATLIDAGRVKPIVSTVLPMAEARAAHELMERGHARGKIVLRVVEEGAPA
jgi:NADPH:quinone reductase-like Zn-dependent oxidoreductase